MHYTPYWLTQNLKTIPVSLEGNELSFYTTTQVIEGDSPLGNLGNKLINDAVIGKMIPFNEIWIFPNKKLDTGIFNNIGNIFCLVSKIKNDLTLSKHGAISFNEHGLPIHAQAPNIQSFEYAYTPRFFTIEEAEDIFELAKFLAKKSNYTEHFFQFNYLKELRCTDPFLGYLGLWSFIEIEWANNPNSPNKSQNTDIKKSLQNLLSQFFKGNRKSKNEFNKRLSTISTKVGKSFGEHSIRNLLAHGKYHLARVEWTGSDNIEFHDIHDELFKIMFSALEENIRSEQ